MDMKIQLSSDLDWIDFEYDELVLCQGNNAFIAMTKHHPLALQMIAAISQNIQWRDYNEDVLAITGSHLLDRILK